MCLLVLASRQREALALRAGIDGAPLEPAQAAALLHLSRGDYARLEDVALTQLQLAAERGQCPSTASNPAGTSSEGVAARLAGASAPAAPAKGVLGVRFARAPGAQRHGAAGAGVTLFGAKLSASPRAAALAVILAALAAALLVALLFADGLGAGPLNREWRRQRRRR